MRQAWCFLSCCAGFILSPSPEGSGGGPLQCAVKLGFRFQLPKASRCLHLKQSRNHSSEAGDDVVDRTGWKLGE